tara:strand:- start:64 stop:303 length:240 start_codon:yes stop_codon:yes gene_type:complete
VTLLTNLGAGAGALIAIFTLFGMFIKYAIVKPIKAYIDKMTYPIQPHANGGRSLPDLVNTVDELKILIVSHILHHDDTQ